MSLVGDDLRAGADRIERGGWYNGTFASAVGNSTCAYLGLGQRDAELALAEFIAGGNGFGEPGPFIVQWNDNQPNAEAVISTMRAAADRADQQ